jgi:hypothetical protein
LYTSIHSLITVALRRSRKGMLADLMMAFL